MEEVGDEKVFVRKGADVSQLKGITCGASQKGELVFLSCGAGHVVVHCWRKDAEGNDSMKHNGDRPSIKYICL